jgi:tetrahydromethanopterin S-methyltransferase subunit G
MLVPDEGPIERIVLKFAKHSELIALIFTTTAVILFAVWVFFDPPQNITPAMASVILGILGLIGFQIVVQRATTQYEIQKRLNQIDRKLEAVVDHDIVQQELHKRLSEIDRKLKHVADHHSAQQELQQRLGEIDRKLEDMVDHNSAHKKYTPEVEQYMRMHELDRHLRRQNPSESSFGNVAFHLLSDPIDILGSLANGRIEVPDYLMGLTFDHVMDAYSDRFDGVSHNDLAFWNSDKPSDRSYHEASYEAAKRMIVTRLFIVPEHHLEHQRQAIVRVLKRQMIENISWALVIEEDLEHLRLHGRPDFALFDGGKAVSYFRGQIRRFVVTFRTEGFLKENDAEIDVQLRRYFMLLTQCLLVSESFSQQHLLVNDPDKLVDLKNRTASRNQQIKPDHLDATQSIFPLIVSRPTDIEEGLNQLSELRRQYHASR